MRAETRWTLQGRPTGRDAPADGAMRELRGPWARMASDRLAWVDRPMPGLPSLVTSGAKGGLTMKKPSSIHLVILVIASALAGSVGCAHSVMVAPKLPEKTLAEKVPLDVGLHITNEFKGYKLSEFRKP